MSHKKRVSVVTRAADGTLRIRNYPAAAPLLGMHSQIGIDDCSTNLSLRGLPVFRELIGPMPGSRNVARYESPEVFEALTRKWSRAKDRRRRHRSRGASAVVIQQLA